ncbi:MAG: energy transducer TonB [Gammaproteobacteria bacterium]|jgi:biopolymer transport protein ExbB|nr:energy transducer TonB [Gammaproteobacteria bacterium]
MKFSSIIKKTLSTSVLCITASFTFGQQQAANLDQLLDLVEQARLTETEEHRQRMQQFQQNVNQRQALLNEMLEREETEQRISVDLENTYNENEIIKAQRFETLQERLGDLDELFGTIAGVVGDTRSQFEASLISAQYPGREETMTELAEIMASESQLPSIEQLERLWFYLLQEMTESANVARFTTDVAQPDGTQNQQEVIRIGSYNIVSGGQYLEFDANTKRLSVLPSQPGDYTSTAADIQSAAGGFTMVGIDPTGPFGGSYLAALISSPSFQERYWEQGRTIGQIIIFVGLFATLLAVERMVTLTLVNAKVKRQLKSPDRPSENNPLGRVLKVYESDKNMNIETLELKLGEAILLETPALERFLTLLKIIATVAPLGGLLGTVTGMITVFQAITLFGTGDPQIMAGGISGALVTTVLGIVVAIPTILFHTIVKSRSDQVIHILEEQATGIIARRAEAQGTSS